jgi:hypothetical protein
VKDDTGDVDNYQIVGSLEADPKRGMISNESPAGRALMGKKPGESATVVAGRRRSDGGRDRLNRADEVEADQRTSTEQENRPGGQSRRDAGVPLARRPIVDTLCSSASNSSAGPAGPLVHFPRLTKPSRGQRGCDGLTPTERCCDT